MLTFTGRQNTREARGSVLKRTCYHHSGVAGPAGQEMTARVGHSLFPRGGTTPCDAGPRGSPRVSQEAETAGARAGAVTAVVVRRTGLGRVTWLQIGWLE